MQLDSCELASSLVEGVWPKTQRASSYICEHSASKDGLFRDLIESRHGCRDNTSKRQSAVKKVIKENEDIFVEICNIAWKALEKSSRDKVSKELLMIMGGTIAVNRDKISVMPPIKQAQNFGVCDCRYGMPPKDLIKELRS